MKFFFLALVFISSPFAVASPAKWHVIKSREKGSLPGGALLKSVTLKEITAVEKEKEAVITAVVFQEQAYQLQVIDNPVRDKTLARIFPTDRDEEAAKPDEARRSMRSDDGCVSPHCPRKTSSSTMPASGFPASAVDRYEISGLAQVMREQHFLAGVNGGYFHPDGRPLGLMISQGKIIHPQETARLLSGLIVVSGEKLQLLRVGEKMPTRAVGVLQAGPFLIDHRAPVVGLESTRIARRTFVATDGHGLWMLGIISPVTLAEAARLLLTAAPRFFSIHPIQRALNLDGGSSSALWVNLSPEPFSQLEIGTVRNFLGIKLKN